MSQLENHRETTLTITRCCSLGRFLSALAHSLRSHSGLLGRFGPGLLRCLVLGWFLGRQ